MNWQSAEEAPPALLVLPPGAASLDEAHGAIEQWEHYSRKTLDPPQRLAVEIMMAETVDGRWAARTTGREMPRQNGKGDEVEVVEFWGLTQRGEAILHTAHELNTVSSAHQRMVALLSHRDFRGKREPKILNGLGQQLIGMGDAVIQYRTRTAGGGRGLDDISRLFVDEAQHARPEQLASATPTLLANPNPQMNFAGTGAIHGVSDWWWSLRIRALGPAAGGFGYLGHTAEKVYLDTNDRVVQEPVDAGDRSIWTGPNPALVYGRADMEFFEEQFRLLGPALFAREHLGVWDPPPLDGGATVIPLEHWKACEDPKASFDQVIGAPVFAVDVTPDRSKCSIAVAGRRSDGMPYAELIENRDGTSWVKVRVAELKRAWGGKAVAAPDGPAGSLFSDGIDLEPVGTREQAQASGLFYDLVTGEKMRHRPDAALDAALASAVKKDIGDGLWLWSRKNSAVDISPLVAVTLAIGAIGTPVTVGFKSLDDYLDDDD